MVVVSSIGKSNGPGKERAVQNVSPDICMAERDSLIPVIMCNVSLIEHIIIYNSVRMQCPLHCIA